MLLIIERTKFIQMLDLVRDDKGPTVKAKVQHVPYVRIEARDDNHVTISGVQAEAEFNATVHESGVLFIRAKLFRDLLATFRKDKSIAIQANDKELAFGDVHFKTGLADFLLYPDPKSAPKHHPGDRLRAAEATNRDIQDVRDRIETAKNAMIDSARTLAAQEKLLAQLLGTPHDPRKVLKAVLDEEFAPTRGRKRTP